jgi:Leucine-rich repeat (LRR) protein
MDLSHNEFTEVPETCASPALKELYIGANYITKIPAWLPVACKQLRTLDIHANCIRSIDAGIVGLPRLKLLNVPQNRAAMGDEGVSATSARKSCLKSVRLVLSTKRNLGEQKVANHTCPRSGRL